MKEFVTAAVVLTSFAFAARVARVRRCQRTLKRSSLVVL